MVPVNCVLDLTYKERLGTISYLVVEGWQVFGAVKKLLVDRLKVDIW